jgi:hypothetical protein
VGVCILVTISLANIPDVLAIVLAECFKNGSEKDAQDNELCIYVEDRKIRFVFIIDRSMSMAVKPVNCRQLKKIL